MTVAIADLPARTDSGTVRRLIVEACAANGCPEIAQRIIVKWNNRYTSALGKALYRSEYDMTVQFSVPLWPRTPQSERLNTIVHEACHIIARYLNRNRRRIQPHGIEWKRAMRRAGFKPERCHSIDNRDLKRKPAKRYTYACNCRTHELSGVRHGRIQRGGGYTCNKCKGTLRRV